MLENTVAFVIVVAVSLFFAACVELFAEGGD